MHHNVARRLLKFERMDSEIMNVNHEQPNYVTIAVNRDKTRVWWLFCHTQSHVKEDSVLSLYLIGSTRLQIPRRHLGRTWRSSGEYTYRSRQKLKSTCCAIVEPDVWRPTNLFLSTFSCTGRTSWNLTSTQSLILILAQRRTLGCLVLWSQLLSKLFGLHLLAMNPYSSPSIVLSPRSDDLHT